MSEQDAMELSGPLELFAHGPHGDLIRVNGVRLDSALREHFKLPHAGLNVHGQQSPRVRVRVELVEDAAQPAATQGAA